LFNYLAGLNADNVEKIELITTPGAGMDAQGNAGFINIVLKKGKNEGVYGSVGGGFGVGSGTVGNLSGDITYNKDRLSLNANYAFSRQAQSELVTNYRKKINNPSDFSIENTNDRNPVVQANHNLYAGINYRIAPKTTIGGAITAYSNKETVDALSSLSVIINQQNSSMETPANELNYWQHLGGNVNINHEFKAGKTLIASFDYLYYNLNNPASYFRKYYDSTGLPIDSVKQKSSGKAPIRIAVGKIDYTILKTNQWSINTGLKATVSRFNNQITVETQQAGGSFLTDTTFAAPPPSLQEEILAAYAEAAYRINKKWDIRAGLRYEHTKDDMGTADSLNENYGNLFPSAIVGYKINDKSSISFTYSKRISRPALTSLVPFVFIFDPYTIRTGNPALKASTSHNIGVNFSVKKLMLSSTYSMETNPLSQGGMYSVDTVKNIQYIRGENFPSQKIFNTMVILQTKVSSFWSMQNTVGGIWKEVESGAHFAQGTLTKWSFSFSSTQSFKLPHSFTAEISGFYNTASLLAVRWMQDFGALDAGIKKSMRRSDISLNYTNILNTNNWIFSGTHLGYTMGAGLYMARPTVKLSYTLKFGNAEGKAKFNKSTGADEERRRVQ
jgi:outer membrane receptor protein involved in Fe transport